MNEAQQYEQEGDWLQAATIYRTLVDRFPENEGYFYHCIDLCSKAGRFGWALDLIEWKKKPMARDLNLDVLKAQIFNRSGRSKEALNLWNAVVDAHPNDEWVVILTANAMVEENLFDHAVQIYLNTRKRLGRPDLFSLNLALTYEKGQEFAKAAVEWLSFVKIYPNQIDAAESHLMRFPSTEKVVRAIDRIFKKEVDIQPGNIELIKLLCRYQLRFGLFQDALETSLVLDSMAPESSRGEALFQFAQKAFLAGETMYLETAYKKITQDFSGFHRTDHVLFYLAQSHAGMGLFREAVCDFESLITRYPESSFSAPALLEKGRLERDPLREPELAIATFNLLISLYPQARQHDEGFLELGDCYLLVGDLEKAKTIYEQSSRMASARDRIVYLRSVVRQAEIEFFLGEFEKSTSRLDSLFQNWLESEEAQDSLVNDALALNLLIKSYLKTDRGALMKLAFGMLLAKQKRFDQALVVFDQLIAQEKKSDPIVAEALFQKGNLLFAAELYKESLSCFEILLVHFPRSFHSERAMEKLGWLQQKNGRFKEAVQTYEHFIELYPRSSMSSDVRKRIRDMEGIRP